MSRTLQDWFYKNHISTKAMFLLVAGLVVLLIVAVSAGSWYYFDSKKQQAEELKRRAAAALQQQRDNIHQFYETTFTGISVADTLTLYQEILRSRFPIELSGFKETHFKCSQQSCDFSYVLQPEAIFNVQEKRFHGESYQASFSATTADYVNLPTKTGDTPLLASFHQHQPIDAPDCTDVLTYWNSYNTLADTAHRIAIPNLPSSSVENDENALKGNPDNYGLMADDWKVVLADDGTDLASFWHGQPYQSFFIINSVEKNNDTLTLDGTFVCKKSPTH